MTADPAQGLTYQWLNFVSARNVANMCVSGGVSHMVLLSSVRALWVSGEYIAAKREAEDYMERVGLRATIIRAPVVYVRGTQRPLFYRVMTLLPVLPPLSWLGFRRIAPMPVDVLARGVARITLDPHATKRTYFAPDLRRRNTARELRQGVSFKPNEMAHQVQGAHPVQLLDEDTPFGWTPPEE
jgi:uncharacterized protein YbjT (DUF2867 family)